MKIHLGKGIDNITFGMTCSEVERIMGKPSREFEIPNYDHELFWEYTEKKLTLTFDKHKGGRLGYIRSSNPNLSIAGLKLMDAKVVDIQPNIDAKVSSWEVTEYFSFTAYFHEANWFCLNGKYGRVTDVELGVPFEKENEYFSDSKTFFKP